MVKLLKAIARVPWWLLYRLVRMERHDKTYDWSWRGLRYMPFTRGALVAGWLFWALVVGALIMLVWKLRLF